MILPKSELVPEETTGGLKTVAIRMPSDTIALELIHKAGGYIAAPSANSSGKPSPTLARHVAEDMGGRIEMILDGGEVGIGLESTIIDLTVEPPQILRPGYITHKMLEEVLGTVEEDATLMRGDLKQAPKAPGMKYRHYAPKGELTIVAGEPEEVIAYINREAAKDLANGERVGVIATGQTERNYQAPVIKSIGNREDESSIARNLYSILRQFDEEEVTRIYSESFAA
jgi:L-threonylcarbamoyladenylate synthase